VQAGASPSPAIHGEPSLWKGEGEPPLARRSVRAKAAGEPRSKAAREPAPLRAGGRATAVVCLLVNSAVGLTRRRRGRRERGVGPPDRNGAYLSTVADLRRNPPLTPPRRGTHSASVTYAVSPPRRGRGWVRPRRSLSKCHSPLTASRAGRWKLLVIQRTRRGRRVCLARLGRSGGEGRQRLGRICELVHVVGLSV
jgi:hypothetical protein